ncbi:MAG: hypothetical protein L0Y72_23275 [Gemmataceae bacterium]|nr:hypothetical protein [Gemmataceae bacterium]MCI0741966.1 hypothetical protein [Gemmataceae bacterium]
MDLCGGLILLAVLLFMMAVFGHGLWLFFAKLFETAGERALDQDRGPQARQRCAGCGTAFAHSAAFCPSCGMDPAGAVSKELRDLEAAAREIQVLVKAELVDATAGEQVYQAIEKRQGQLLQGAGATPVAARPLWQRLDHLLLHGTERQKFTAEQRRQALTWYRQLPERELAYLQPGSLLSLARLVRAAGLCSRTLQLYDLFLKNHPRDAQAAEVAQEAGRFAAQEQRDSAAQHFFEMALGMEITKSDREQAEAALQRLGSEVIVATPVHRPARNQQAATIPVPEPGEPAPPPVPAPPRRTWGQLLAGFMEERNILWGELVGGLLIVGCSIALVISLWQTLEQIPYFPFLLFAGITSALFGAGLYTLGHWKLEATSRGLLVIASLLVPLDFLVLAGLSHGRVMGPLNWATEALALIGFAAMVYRIGGILLHKQEQAGVRAGLFALAVVGASAMQLFAHHWLELEQPNLLVFVLLSMTPVFCQGAALAWELPKCLRANRLEAESANQLLLFLGVTSFAVATALGFLVYWSEEPLRTLQHLAVPLNLAALPLVLVGALVQQKVADTAQSPGAPTSHGSEAEAQGLSPGLARLVGGVIALAGLGIFALALALAWPRTIPLVLVGFGSAAALSGIALGFRLPALHAGGIVFLVAGALTAFHALRGAWPDAADGGQLVTLFASPPSGSLLAILAGLLTLSAEMLLRRERRADALIHAAGAAALVVLALALVSAPGAAPLRAALVYGGCTVLTFAVNVRWRHPAGSAAGSLMLLGALAKGLRCVAVAWTPDHFWLWVFLLHAGTMLLASFALDALLTGKYFLRPSTPEKSEESPLCAEYMSAIVVPMRLCGLVVSFVALLPLAGYVSWDTLPACAAFSVGFALLWLVTSWRLFNMRCSRRVRQC